MRGTTISHAVKAMIPDVTPTEMPRALLEMSNRINNEDVVKSSKQLFSKTEVISQFLKLIKDSAHTFRNTDGVVDPMQLHETLKKMQDGACDIAAASIAKFSVLQKVLLTGEGRDPVFRLACAGIRTLRVLGGQQSEQIVANYQQFALGLCPTDPNFGIIPANLHSFLGLCSKGKTFGENNRDNSYRAA